MKALSLFKNENNKTITWNDQNIEEKSQVLLEKKSDNMNLPLDCLNLKEIIIKIDKKQRNIETITSEILKLDTQKRVLDQFIERNKEDNKQNINIKLQEENERIYFPFILITQFALFIK